VSKLHCLSLGRARGAVERPAGRRHTSDVPMGCAILDMSASLISNVIAAPT
jgi:hypothetical protein